MSCSPCKLDSAHQTSASNDEPGIPCDWSYWRDAIISSRGVADDASGPPGHAAGAQPPRLPLPAPEAHKAAQLQESRTCLADVFFLGFGCDSRQSILESTLLFPASITVIIPHNLTLKNSYMRPDMILKTTSVPLPLDSQDAARDPRERARDLLTELPRRGPTAFDDFVSALREMHLIHVVQALKIQESALKPRYATFPPYVPFRNQNRKWFLFNSDALL